MKTYVIFALILILLPITFAASQDFNVNLENNYYSFCSHTVQNVPIVIENKMASQNTYYLSPSFNSPAWMNFDQNSITLNPSQKGIVNLILNPDYSVNGAYKINLTIIPEEGPNKAIVSIDTQIKNCTNQNITVQSIQETNSTSLWYRISNYFSNLFSVSANESVGASNLITGASTAINGIPQNQDIANVFKSLWDYRNFILIALIIIILILIIINLKLKKKKNG